MTQTTHILFFRNMNLGHPGSPTRQQLETACLEAGATTATSFQTNGTLLFHTAAPDEVKDRMAQTLANVGYRDTGFLRTINWLDGIVPSLPAADPIRAFYRETFTIYDATTDPELPTPWTSPDGLVELDTITRNCSHGLCWKPRSQAGSPTAHIENLLNTPATTRTMGTIQRLLARPR